MSKNHSLKDKAQRWTAVAGKRYMTLLADKLRSVADSIPGPTLPNFAAQDVPGENWSEVPLGVSERGEVTWNVQKNQHMLVLGRAGTGKTVMARSVLRHCVNHPDAWEVYGVDFRGTEFPAYSSSQVSVATQRQEALDLLERLQELQKERLENPKQEGRNVLLLVDEVVPFDSTQKGIKDEEFCREFLKRVVALLSHGKETRIHVILNVQSVESLLDRSLTRSFSYKALLGHQTSEAQSLIMGGSSEDYAPTLGSRPGRGIVVEDDEKPIQFQAYYSVPLRPAI